MNGFNSEDFLIPHGFLQGSVLGLLLFPVYINDFFTSIKFSKVH